MSNWPTVVLARPEALWLLVLVPVVWIFSASRGSRRRQRRVLMTVRSLVLVMLIVSLASPMLARDAGNVTTVFVIDRSASVQQGSIDAADAWVAEAMGQAGPTSDSAVVSFSSDAGLTSPAGPAQSMGTDWMSPDLAPGSEQSTNLSSALTLARALPVGEQRRIVVLSDGSENVGNAIEQADQAAIDGVPIDVVPLAGVDAGDLRVSRLVAPSAIWQGDTLAMLANLSVGGGGPATVELIVDGQRILQQNLQLQPGETSYSLSAPALDGGFHRVEVHISSSAGIDRISENNVAFLGVVVRERPTVLVVSPDGSDPTRLETALRSQGAEITSATPANLPIAPEELARWDAVVLNNVSAWELSVDQQEAIVAHTRGGNGLIVIGGSASYGPGSYAGTELESALPVTVKVVDGQQRPKVAVMIIMDKSGSMSYDPSTQGEPKIELAKDGVVTAASALTAGDQIGVIAFNDEPVWALPMTTLTGQGDLQRVQDAISPLEADGGTELYPALQVGYDSMRNVNADVRHIIVLSDGKSHSGNEDSYKRLISEIGNDNITLSTVALGTDADLELLQSMADFGGGQYHVANSPEDIPRITFEEAQGAGSQSVLRGAFSPIQQQPSPILNDIDVATMPQVDGYNFAEGRPDAQVDLVSDRGDPLLVKWQLGLGRVVAWTADDGSDYAANWEQWAQYDQFWGGVMRWSLPDPTNQAVTASIVQNGTDSTIVLDSMSPDGDAIDLAQSSASVYLGDGTSIEAVPVANGPGIYEIALDSPPLGGVRVDLALTGGPTPDWAMATAIQPAPEWFPVVDGAALLTTIAERTSGTVRSLDTPPDASLFAPLANAGSGPGTVVPIWQWPLGIALIAFVLEIAWRMGVISRTGRHDNS